MPFKAFTCKYQGTAGSIIISCGVSEPIRDISNGVAMTSFKALLDTGATSSVISGDIAKKLNLLPVSKTTVHHANGQSIVNVYNISLALPNHVLFPFVRVTEGILSGFDMLIGMDIITKGDFSISNKDGKTTFSFRLPSYKETDFVVEYHELKIKAPAPIPFVSKKKTGRNDPCPCGSGKKYKTCHGR